MKSLDEKIMFIDNSVDIDWKNVQKECPKAFEYFIKIYDLYPAHGCLYDRLSDDIKFYERFLYDFFDQEEIYISITHNENYKWEYNVESNDKRIIQGSSECMLETRKQAEIEALKVAFEFLETIIKLND